MMMKVDEGLPKMFQRYNGKPTLMTASTRLAQVQQRPNATTVDSCLHPWPCVLLHPCASMSAHPLWGTAGPGVSGGGCEPAHLVLPSAGRHLLTLVRRTGPTALVLKLRWLALAVLLRLRLPGCPAPASGSPLCDCGQERHLKAADLLLHDD